MLLHADAVAGSVKKQPALEQSCERSAKPPSGEERIRQGANKMAGQAAVPENSRARRAAQFHAAEKPKTRQYKWTDSIERPRLR
jgi:hypothetical protein